MLDLGRVPAICQHFGLFTLASQSLRTNAPILRPWPTLTPRTEWQAAMAPQRVTEGLRLRRAACWGQP